MIRPYWFQNVFSYNKIISFSHLYSGSVENWKLFYDTFKKNAYRKWCNLNENPEKIEVFNYKIWPKITCLLYFTSSIPRRHYYCVCECRITSWVKICICLLPPLDIKKKMHHRSSHQRVSLLFLLRHLQIVKTRTQIAQIASLYDAVYLQQFDTINKQRFLNVLSP